MKLKIAIFSDFHCHSLERNKNTQESYLLTDIEIDVYQDPFESLIKLIEDGSDLSSDILILPGDFANKCDPDGLEQGWAIAKNIGALLKVEAIIPTVGNHDVDSRKTYHTDPFHHIKTFAKDFPFPESSMNERFWRQGYIIIENDRYRILNINSVHSHTDEEMAKKGLISQEALNQIERELDGSSIDKINIAICHHNPIEHSHYNTGSKDFMHNGDELISILDRMNFDLIIHGHKHDPRIRYAQGGANAPTVFSSGSFAAFKNLLLQGANNTFHIITLECNDTHIGNGTIDTWFFVPTKGWKQNVRNSFFEPKIGFGKVVDIRALSIKIYDWFIKQKINYIEWEELAKEFIEIDFMIPSDLEKLKSELRGRNILVSPIILNEPTFVQFKRKI